ncbi:MAG: DNA alkylation repair protein [Bacteroidales bacterium]|jgi:3-methyladenine DNA glycosylase AlkD|nr:DNA alkylation repair protein [Bacteroidales bacterium]
MTPSIIDRLRQDLMANVDAKTQASAQHYFKEAITAYGVTVPKVNAISKTYFGEVKQLDKSVVWDLCETLWQSGILEESFVACHWSYALSDRFEPADFAVFERWVQQYVSNWASCDTLCNHTIGALVERYPVFLENLKVWTASENRWVRRASVVSLIIQARKGLFLSEVFDLAERLLTDTDDLVQKGYGWLLKAASEAHQEAVFQFVLAHKTTMPRTALRYAIEKMPPTLKAEAMKK